jgi:hypothetical protein
MFAAAATFSVVLSCADDPVPDGTADSAGTDASVDGITSIPDGGVDASDLCVFGTSHFGDPCKLVP